MSSILINTQHDDKTETILMQCYHAKPHDVMMIRGGASIINYGLKIPPFSLRAPTGRLQLHRSEHYSIVQNATTWRDNEASITLLSNYQEEAPDVALIFSPCCHTKSFPSRLSS